MNSELQERLFDDMLISALGECIEMEDPELLSEDEMRAAGMELPEVSPRFYRKMNRFNRKRKKKLWFARNQKRINAIAATFLIVFLIGGYALYNVDAVRIPVQNFFFEMGGYFVTPDKEKTNVSDSSSDLTIPEEYAEYLPSYVLDGFHLVAIDELDSMIALDYQNDSEDFYKIKFWLTNPDSFVDGESAQISTVEIQGTSATIVKELSLVSITWTPNGHKYSIAGYITEADAISILESTGK